MGQEQSYVAHASVAPRRYSDRYDDPVSYRSAPADYRSAPADYCTAPADYRDGEYKRHKPRRSAESFKSDHSTESSGYRSGSSAYDCQSEQSNSDYNYSSLYKNNHYKEVNKELYRPVKIPKDRRCKSQLFDVKEDLQSSRLKSYFSDSEKAKSNTTPKKTGIRNYTPKILSEEEQRKKIDNWI